MLGTESELGDYAQQARKLRENGGVPFANDVLAYQGGSGGGGGGGGGAGSSGSSGSSRY